VELLRERYPHEKWERLFMVRGRLAQQRRLEKMAASLFPVSWNGDKGGKGTLFTTLTQDVEMKVNARKEADLRNPQTGDYLELDIYIPALRLAFEYQVILHPLPPTTSNTPEAQCFLALMLGETSLHNIWIYRQASYLHSRTRHKEDRISF